MSSSASACLVFPSFLIPPAPSILCYDLEAVVLVNTRDTHSSVAALLAMSGFDDDFGEMVEPAEVATDIADLLSTAVKNNDPAADFLAREQQQLGELEVDIGALAGRNKIIGHVLQQSGFSVSSEKSHNCYGKKDKRGIKIKLLVA